MQVRLTFFFLFAVLASCSTEKRDSAGKEKNTQNQIPADSVNATVNSHTIAVIPKGTTHEFWKAVEAGARHAADQFDHTEIIWKGPLKEDDRDAQISVVENFIQKKVSGIVLAPLDDKALRMPVIAANRQGIPVIIFDSGLDSEEYVSFVATDNYKGGRMAAEHLAEIIGGRGKVLILRYQEGSASTMKREQGFLDALKDTPEIEILSSNQYGGATTESAYQASENLLSRFKTNDGVLEVDGLFTPNESTTFGMLRALQDGGFVRSVKFVGFDSSPKLVQALRADEIHGLVVQNPFKMGFISVTRMIDHLEGRNVEKRIDTGATLVTKENMNDESIQKLIKPAE